MESSSKTFRIGKKIHSKYLNIEIIAWAYDYIECFRWLFSVNTSARAFLNQNIQIVVKIAHDSSPKYVSCDNPQDELFLATFKQGFNSISARIKSESKLKLLTQYFQKYPFLNLRDLTIYYWVIEDNLEQYIPALNLLRLKTLTLENKPRKPEKLALLAQLLHLKELTLHLSRVKKKFFIDTQPL